jgi:hypothetical protein
MGRTIDIRNEGGQDQIDEIEWSDSWSNLHIDYEDNTVKVNNEWVDLAEIPYLIKALERAVDLLPVE